MRYDGENTAAVTAERWRKSGGEKYCDGGGCRSAGCLDVPVMLW